MVSHLQQIEPVDRGRLSIQSKILMRVGMFASVFHTELLIMM